MAENSGIWPALPFMLSACKTLWSAAAAALCRAWNRTEEFLVSQNFHSWEAVSFLIAACQAGSAACAAAQLPTTLFGARLPHAFPALLSLPCLSLLWGNSLQTRSSNNSFAYFLFFIPLQGGIKLAQVKMWVLFYKPLSGIQDFCLPRGLPWLKILKTPTKETTECNFINPSKAHYKRSGTDDLCHLNQE